MLPIQGIFEIAVRVKDLSRSEAFYKNVLGLEVSMRDEQRNWLFMWIGRRSGMIVLQEDKNDWPVQHFAFKIASADLDGAASLLRKRGVTVSEPVQHGAMGGTSVYFDDPDGNQLELYASVVE
jgi:catechol 2,3-dioxygenase-like lactoylglutathione lyase family enzyme